MEERLAELNPRTCVVLGGRGFLGRSLVHRLLTLGKWIVRVADSAQSLHPDPSDDHHDSLLSQALSSGRASYHRVDVRDYSQIVKAIEGSFVVFYMDDINLQRDDIYNWYMIIVQGAKNVINACRECKVRRLIYNSSADVVFDGLHDINNGDECLTYPWKFEDMMSDLKAQAEALVLFANNIDGLLTCALRPSNVFGPGDTQLLPLLVNLVKSGWAKYIIGSGENMSDFTYVENVTHAHICAEEALDFRMVSVAGKAFFISNIEPMKFWEFVSRISEGLGYQRPFIKVPVTVVGYILLIFKWMHGKLGFKKYNHSVSAYYIQLASRTRTFDCTAAQKHIGYSPVVSLEEAVTLTIDSLSHLTKDSYYARYSAFDEQSKVEKLLGSGEVADILLWRDEKKTFTYFLALVLLFYWFFLSGRTFMSSIAKLLLLINVVLFGYGILSSKTVGITFQRISSSCFEISETVVKDSITTLACLWNNGVQHIRSLSQGEDWSNFFKVTVSLYFLKLILRSLTAVIGVALVFAFTVFFVYEQYETEIDGFAKVLFNRIEESMGLLTRNLSASGSSFLLKCDRFHRNKVPAAVQHQR
ncbi:3beta-hydroxysteroid-dehydrogenase/decarboxylase isoform X2 [Alnus glutinosa]|uniref:3beta-hydroxysteroid-dehydrogenase/decarboxylase isoform X2 n=1 Tax=Alnus glutinosa TaxID=3517 RepID=UPI002D77C965|nr:3beta-hydroxysteroid-dehydrogenase/decarboxylase isoform X2 [Alnus glutinosa]